MIRGFAVGLGLVLALAAARRCGYARGYGAGQEFGAAHADAVHRALARLRERRAEAPGP
ncbi:MAG TPA: hypothetical protein VF041_23080 [Gemmatimonadaceae bacterium]